MKLPPGQTVNVPPLTFSVPVAGLVLVPLLAASVTLVTVNVPLSK